MYALLHIARIITFVTLFVEATTHNVTDSFYPDKDKTHEEPLLIDIISQNEPTILTKFFKVFVKQPTLITILLLILVTIVCCIIFYCYWLLQWYLNNRQRTLMEIIWEFLLYRWLPHVFGPIIRPVWRRIVELIRPPANDDNRVAARYRARNINPHAREIELRAE